MTFSEFQKKAAALPETEMRYEKHKILWMPREEFPMEVFSLPDPGHTTVKIPGSVVNEYAIRVPVRFLTRPVFAGNETLEELILPPSIQWIQAGSFKGCRNLKRITLPKGVREIREGTFRDCETLEDIYYEGTPEEWTMMEIVHKKHEMEFGPLVPGTANAPITAERWVPIPGNEALFRATVHFRCDLKSLYRDE